MPGGGDNDVVAEGLESSSGLPSIVPLAIVEARSAAGSARRAAVIFWKYASNLAMPALIDCALDSPARKSGSSGLSRCCVSWSIRGSSASGTPRMPMITCRGKKRAICVAKSHSLTSSILRSTYFRERSAIRPSSAFRNALGLNQSLVTER